MGETKKKGPVFDPGLCRCCGTMKKCRVLNVEYECFGQKEVYSDIIMDCFGLLMSHLDGKVTERLVCATCVNRLREAFSFKNQVLQCEEAFLQCRMYDANDTEAKAVQFVESNEQYCLAVKSEPEDVEKDCSDVDLGADVVTGPIDEVTKAEHLNENSNSNDDLPLKSVAAKLRKAEGAPLAARRPRTDHNWWTKQRHVDKKPKLPIAKVQELIREKDNTYMIDTNIISIVEYSYACPFKCRHNNLHCYYCTKHFLDPTELREHTIMHNPKNFKVVDYKNMVKLDLTKIDCRLCSAEIDDLDKFKRHLTEIHGKKYYFDAKDCVLPFRLRKDEIKCAVCDSTFPYFHALNKHMNEHYRNYVCENCGLGFVDRNRFLMHLSRHEQGSFPCETCGKLFKAEYNRDLHIDRVHKKRGRVYCSRCDARLMSHPQKLRHLAAVHGERPPLLPCSLCDKVYETRRMLTIHWRKEHLKDYRYECQVCGQKFFTRFALNNHMPTHTGERNYKCKECEKTYPRLKTLKEHMRIHNNDRRYRCNICGQAFIQNCSLKGHMKSQHPEYG